MGDIPYGSAYARNSDHFDSLWDWQSVPVHGHLTLIPLLGEVDEF